MKNNSITRQSIFSLQKMLHVLSKYEFREDAITPTGIYDLRTVNAVTQFQTDHGIPATGITNQTTWDLISAEYEKVRVDVEPAQALNVDIGCKEVFHRGDSSPILHLAQDMLNLYSTKLKSLCMTTTSGVLDEATENALQSFQHLCGIPATGALDKITWKHLCLHYCGVCAMDCKE